MCDIPDSDSNVYTKIAVTSDAHQPSLSNPTKFFLKSLTKIELQKHGREIGVQKVWMSKENLIDMIMEKSQLM